MLTWTVICLLGALLTSLGAYKKEPTTMTYIVKILFFLFLFTFLFLLVASALTSIPTPAHDPMFAA